MTNETIVNTSIGRTLMLKMGINIKSIEDLYLLENEIKVVNLN